MKVLLVDDNAQDRVILRHHFRKRKYDVVEASNGEEGFEQALLERPDLIISDGFMPRMDGFRLLRKIRTHPDLVKTHFIFYSALYTDQRELDFVRAMGADGYIAKPMVSDDLFREIEAILGKAGEGSRVIQKDEGPQGGFDFLEQYSRIVVARLEEKVSALEREVHRRQTTEKVLISVVNEWEQIFNAYLDPFLVLDINGMIKRCNRAMIELIGIPAADMVGRDCAAVMGCDEKTLASCPLRRALKSRRRESAVLEYHGREFDVIADPMFDSEGVRLGAIHILLERKKAAAISR